MTVEEVYGLRKEARENGYGPRMLSEILHMYRQYELCARWGLPDGPRYADAVHWQQCADECESLLEQARL